MDTLFLHCAKPRCRLGHGLLLHGIHARQAANARLVQLQGADPLFGVGDVLEALLKTVFKVFEIDNYGIAFCCDFINSDNTRQIMTPTKQIENALLKPDRV